jgi:hypothetical protein
MRPPKIAALALLVPFIVSATDAGLALVTQATHRTFLGYM